MDMVRRIGTAPTRAEAMLAAALQSLRGKAGAAGLLDQRLFAYADKLAQRLPSHFLADVYLEQPLVGDGGPCAALVLDSVERNYLNHHSDGAYLRQAGIPAALGPEDFDLMCGLVADGGGVRPFELRDDSLDVRDLTGGGEAERQSGRYGVTSGEMAGQAAFLCRLTELGVAACVLVRDEGDAAEVVVAPVKVDPRATFERAPYRDAMRVLLSELGCEPGSIDALDELHVNCGVQGYSVAAGVTMRAVMADVAYVRARWEAGALVGASVGVLLTDRIASESRARKPGISYQWHITDECDQRCKHCYLFAEDARRRCVSTPWEQLMRTLDEVERSAARRGGVAELAISGGDPILHPRFWDFAAELHARGIRWTAMGNPFHLDEGVCRRLRSLGCYQYQMSLDGLEPFHDYLRKPGSHAATLAALGPLNAAGIQTQLMATASKQNLDDILACMDIAVERGATSFAFARYCATSRAKAAELYPSAEEYRAFLLAYHRKKQDYERAGCRTRFKEKDHLFTLLRWELGEFEVPAWAEADPSRVQAGCHLGAKCTIAANGDLLACRRMESVVGNIRVDGLWETDTGAAMAAYADPSRIKKCADCELVLWCRGCRAVGVNATGDLQAADPMCWHEPGA